MLPFVLTGIAGFFVMLSKLMAWLLVVVLLQIYICKEHYKWSLILPILSLIYLFVIIIPGAAYTYLGIIDESILLPFSGGYLFILIIPNSLFPISTFFVRHYYKKKLNM